MTDKKVYWAFSLPEVLITLTIVGVLASITIPAIMQNIQDRQLKTAWKKAYSDISQALNQIKYDQGGNFNECLNALTLRPLLIKYLNTSKNCGNHDCIYTNTKPAFNYKSLSNTPLPDPYLFDDGQLILNNGMFIMLENNGSGAGYFHVIWIDVNGYQKLPNTIGRDVFGIQLYENTFKPLGAEGTSVTYYGSVTNTCNTTSNLRSGMGCSAQYLYE